MGFLSKQKGTSAASGRNRVATGIAAFTSRMQHRWVKAMESAWHRLSRNVQITAFLIFVIVGGGYYIYCIASAFVGPVKRPPPMAQLSRPHLSEQRLREVGIVSDEDFLRIQHFKIYLDSMGRSPGGKRKRDSLLSSRPGLMDSIAAVEEIYRIQHKKSSQ